MTTLEEQAALGSGASFWKTKGAPGLPGIVLSDGPHGVRAQDAAVDHVGIAPSQPATCFPPAAGLAQSWDPDLVARVGRALAAEAREYGVGVLLGPGINIKRDPRAGRNFEYFSEDPHLTGVLGAAWVTGLQSGGVGASVKHFAANNSETDRMRSDSVVDERTLREIYLRGFEKVVREAKPWTVMAAYNRVNGEYACENRWLLTDVLRSEWGFDGVVLSDWGAVDDRVSSVAAGMDLEMPGGHAVSDSAVVTAVEAGVLDAADVAKAAANVTRLLEHSRDASATRAPAVDFDAHHALAREAAARSTVLLKNDGGLLPLAPHGRIVVIGEFARAPRFQGGGSSHVNAIRVDIPFDEIRELAPAAELTFAAGFGVSGDAAALREEAVIAARASDAAIVFLGLGEHDESEGFDRADIEIPGDQIELLRAVVAAQPRTVVVLSHGGVVRLAEIERSAPAIVDGALGGQAFGGGVADVLFGVVNPSGRTSETVPQRLEDVPAFLSFPGGGSEVRYTEGVFVGYRWYDARDLNVTFPFGHGLSYTSFAYRDLAVDVVDGALRVAVTVDNTGARDGREVIQVYVGKQGSGIPRAPRELKAFAHIAIAAGASETVVFDIPRADLAYWDESVSAWVVEDGDHDVSVGASSRDIRVTGGAELVGDDIPRPLTERSTLGELMQHPVAGPMIASMGARQTSHGASNDDAMGSDTAKMMAQIPLNRMIAFSGGQIGQEQIAGLLAMADADGSGQ
ncbi:glycoside hydrolase family 3 C-terminal domain-containing protein [Microbacterium aoyamense]|uniref:Glycoside hydrolase family 3 C-terminal domain-containing protein n=1 Tax=Microbacterium aoyamense TaxID=344166 RepID=A0ABP5B4N8_9MICO|nr:glycoside hydrolase family 3 C-terminal domain-containing protein [Microbacterium aoyamense]